MKTMSNSDCILVLQLTQRVLKLQYQLDQERKKNKILWRLCYEEI